MGREYHGPASTRVLLGSVGPVTAERLYGALGTAPGELDRAFETWVRAEARRHGVAAGAG